MPFSSAFSLVPDSSLSRFQLICGDRPGDLALASEVLLPAHPQPYFSVYAAARGSPLMALCF